MNIHIVGETVSYVVATRFDAAGVRLPYDVASSAPRSELATVLLLLAVISVSDAARAAVSENGHVDIVGETVSCVVAIDAAGVRLPYDVQSAAAEQLNSSATSFWLWRGGRLHLEVMKCRFTT